MCSYFPGLNFKPARGIWKKFHTKSLFSMIKGCVMTLTDSHSSKVRVTVQTWLKSLSRYWRKTTKKQTTKLLSTMLDLYNILHNRCPWPNGVCDEIDQGSYLEGQGHSAHVSKFMSKYCKLGYCPPPFTKVGDIKTHSSVCHKDFNLAHIFWSINDRALIFGMHDPCDMSFQLVPCGDLDLLPTSRSNLLPGGGPQFFELACFRLGKILRKCNTDFYMFVFISRYQCNFQSSI